MKKKLIKPISVILVAVMALCVMQFIGFNKSESVKAAEGNVKEADIFLIAGQSNAAGSTKVTATPDGKPWAFMPTENVLYYGETHRTIAGAGTGRRIRDLRPVQHGCGFTDNHVGFELGLAQYLNDCEEYRGNMKKAIIFKSAAGGTSVMPSSNYSNFGNWYPRSLWEIDYENEDYYNFVGLQYRAFLDTFVDAQKAIRDAGYQKITLKGLFWMQGESDRGQPEEYVKICKALFEDFRTDLSRLTGDDYSALPIYVGEISKTFGSADANSVNANMNLINAQYTIASQMKNVYNVRLRDYDINRLENGVNIVVGSDSAHWNYLDVINIGEDFAEKYAATYGKINNYVRLVVNGGDQSFATAAKLCKSEFLSEYGPNFADNTEYLDWKIELVSQYGLESISAENANIELIETEYADGAVAPTLTYRISELGTKDVNLNVNFKKNKTYGVNITCSDNTYGRTPNKKGILPAYSGNKYIVKTYPDDMGAVEKLIINGITVSGKIDVTDYVLEDWEEKFKPSEHKGLNIEIVYGEYDAVKKKLSGSAEQNDGGNCNCQTKANAVDFIAMFAALSAVLFIFRKK